MKSVSRWLTLREKVARCATLLVLANPATANVVFALNSGDGDTIFIYFMAEGRCCVSV